MRWKRVRVTIHLNSSFSAIPCLDMLTVLRLRLALVEMKLVLGMVLNKFSVTVDDMQNDDEMEGIQMAVLAPRGERCLLKFSHH